MNKQESKNERFKRLAEKRVTRVLEDLRILGNLSNSSLYKYSDAEVKRIFAEIDEALKDTRASFRRGRRKERKKFKL